MSLMIQRWESVSFVHWSYEPAQVKALIPRGLMVDTIGDRTWVSLVAFFVKARLPLMPPIPPFTYFAQVNLRTYVVGADGRPGLWFFSLDADSLGAAIGGRLLYRVPFHWSKTEMSQSANTIEYLIRRRSDMSVGAKVTVEVVEPGRRLDLDSLSRFRVERYVMFGGSSNRLNTATAEHPALDAPSGSGSVTRRSIASRRRPRRSG
jgi:uncharacterized protein YqjF (DUF2071 family)